MRVCACARAESSSGACQHVGLLSITLEQLYLINKNRSKITFGKQHVFKRKRRSEGSGKSDAEASKLGRAKRPRCTSKSPSQAPRDPRPQPGRGLGLRLPWPEADRPLVATAHPGHRSRARVGSGRPAGEGRAPCSPPHSPFQGALPGRGQRGAAGSLRVPPQGGGQVHKVLNLQRGQDGMVSPASQLTSVCQVPFWGHGSYQSRAAVAPGPRPHHPKPSSLKAQVKLKLRRTPEVCRA